MSSVSIRSKNLNAHLNPKRRLDPIDLEAEREGSAIRAHNAIRLAPKRKPKRGSCRQTRNVA